MFRGGAAGNFRMLFVPVSSFLYTKTGRESVCTCTYYIQLSVYSFKLIPAVINLHITWSIHNSQHGRFYLALQQDLTLRSAVSLIVEEKKLLPPIFFPCAFQWPISSLF